MLVIRKVAELSSVVLVLSADGVLWPLSKPLPVYEFWLTLYQSGGKVLSALKSSCLGALPNQSLLTCQLTQFGIPRSRLYDKVYCGFWIRKLFSLAGSAIALLGLPKIRF